jgi:hypothetical protein
MKHRLFTLPIVAAMLLSAPVLSAPQEQKDPQTLATEGIQQLIRAMELMLLAIPQFEAPIINDNGDIIIRRKHPQRRRHKDGPALEKRKKSI